MVGGGGQLRSRRSGFKAAGARTWPGAYMKKRINVDGRRARPLAPVGSKGHPTDARPARVFTHASGIELSKSSTLCSDYRETKRRAVPAGSLMRTPHANPRHHVQTAGFKFWRFCRLGTV